ncbi:MAG: ABC transporter substrate-binding protein [Candidatus Methylomirabilia bacterium]
MKLLRNGMAVAAAMLMVAGMAMSGAAGEVPGVTKDEIKIGTFGPLTGPVYIYGKLTMNGLDALFEKVNEEGGVHGRKLKLIREDDLCKPEGAIAAVKKLVYEHKVFAINGGACSNATLAAKPEIVRAGIPFLVFAAVADGITSPPSPNIFTSQLTASIESRAQLKYALDRDAKKVAVVAQHDAWGRSRYRPLMAAMKAQGIKAVADEEMTVDVNDGTAQALRIMNAGADAVVLVLYPKPAAVLIRDSLKLGYKPHWIGQTAIQDLPALQEQVGIPGALEKFASITTVPAHPSDPEMTEWRNRIQRLFPGDALSVFNLMGIGSGQVLVEALKRAGPDLTQEKFLKALGTIKNFETGMYPGPITCNPPESHQCNQSPAWIRLVGGKVKFIGVTTLD